MDLPAAYDHNPGHAIDVPTGPEILEESVYQQRDRRREKPLLSCTFCRRRKVRCDRQLPCNTCIDKGIALSCSYTAGSQQKSTASVREHIQQLESLVLTLMQQQIAQPFVVPLDDTLTDQNVTSFGNTPRGSPPNIPTIADGQIRVASGNKGQEQPTTSLATDTSKSAAAYPEAPEYGDMCMHSRGGSYVNNVHWAAVLDSISELKDQYEMEEGAKMRDTNQYLQPRHIPSPRLFYDPVQATKADILASIPVRPVVDRMVSRYFNTQGIAPVVIHSGQFLQEYESFWRDPTATPFSWIGLLFSILGLSTQFQHLTDNSANPDTLVQIHLFRERTVNCLVLGQYTRAGPHILETMLIYYANEALLCKDADIGLWLLVGMLVQLAVSQGYHRDPEKFSNITPFVGEMRRRVWAAIVQVDLRLSSQMGLPRLLKSQECDTKEPRNLLDTDFNDSTIELPPSRPETEVTPILYTLAKNRIDRFGGLISDLIADTREHSYIEIMELDQKLQEAETSLPPIFRWQPLNQSFMIPPQIIFHRIFLQLALQRYTIWLHRKYMARSQTEKGYEHSRDACLQAATKILEFQQLVEEETQPHGQLQSMPWAPSPLMQSVFLLGMSVLCYYVHVAKTAPGFPLDTEMGSRIYTLLQKTYPMLLRSSIVSRDARQAVAYLSVLLGRQDDRRSFQEPIDSLAHLQETSVSFDEVNWDRCEAYNELTLGSLELNQSTLLGEPYFSSLSHSIQPGL